MKYLAALVSILCVSAVANAKPYTITGTYSLDAVQVCVDKVCKPVTVSNPTVGVCQFSVADDKYVLQCLFSGELVRGKYPVVSVTLDTDVPVQRTPLLELSKDQYLDIGHVNHGEYKMFSLTAVNGGKVYQIVGVLTPEGDTRK